MSASRGAALPRRAPRAGRAGRLIGLLLIAAGLVMVLYWASDFVAAALRQRGDQARWEQLLASGGDQHGSPGTLAHPVDGIDFRLQVPRLGYSAIVREGVGLDVLATGPGHYPSTGWPGQSGNVGVAAHNVYWIQFSELRPGDSLVLQTRYGTFRYQMSASQIVTPDDTSVLQARQDRQLTLTTCWPLWAGQFANRRLVIFARSAA
jgi:sortase A